MFHDLRKSFGGEPALFYWLLASLHTWGLLDTVGGHLDVDQLG